MIDTQSSPRRGFTLFEVAISLGLLAFGVVSVIMLFPMGIRAQQLARFQLYAAAKAEEMVECFSTTHNANPAIDVEAYDAWDVPVGRRSLAWDLESRLASHRFGMLPLPVEIARRIDSDGDEIQRILAEGGYLYYSQPMATSNLEEQAMSAAPPNEAQRLVFAVTGYAQSNAIGLLPQKSWPYIVPYPSPPSYGPHKPDSFIAGGGTVTTANTPGFDENAATRIICWEANTPNGTPLPGADPQIKGVFDAYVAYYTTPKATVTEALATAYLQAALLYCAQKITDTTQLSGFISPPSPATFPYDTEIFIPGTNPVGAAPAVTSLLWKQVQAMRFLSHAATCMTRWHTLSELSGAGLAIPALSGSPALTLTNDLIVYYHERCLRLAMTFAASFPYDWGCPRPLQRTIMTDYPLIEYDMFSPPLTGKIFSGSVAASSIDAAQWRPLGAQPVQNPGVSYQYPDHPLPAPGSPGDAGFWGDRSHVTLTRAFDAAERCRQIVFWAVDWQSYEDCETAPSAPVDASKYPFRAPVDGEDINARLNTEFRDEQIYAFRNPEKVLSFSNAAAPQKETGASVLADELLNNMSNSYPPDQGSSANAKSVFSGLYGGDRNFNKVLDRGPVPRSVRLRAIPVGRFNYYDPRLTAIVR
ncbi:MAG: hypothetical protein H0X38_04610 [Planctomycetes bacterium]|nr:hypothetical protein [Planctomycetota bacterium]